MRILIRCDGGPGVGVGHAVRSLALAEEAMARGHEVAIAGTLSGPFLEQLVAGAGASVSAMAEVDAEALAERARGYDVLHLDHYDVSPATLDALRSDAGRGSPRPILSTMADGAYGARDADLAIDCTPGSEVPEYGWAAAWLLRGPRFTPLRRRVRELSTASRADVGERQRPDVLVVMGGVDPQALAPAVMEALATTGLGLDVTVVATPHTRGALEELSARWADGTATVVDAVADLPARMARADLVVSAAGTSVWELAALGSPMALVAAVDNQLAGYNAVVKAGAAVGLGGVEEARDPGRAGALLAPVLRDPGERLAMAQRASGIVDGLGAWRIVSAWESVISGARAGQDQAGLALRAATMEDARLLHDWRNDPGTRAMSRNADAVSLEHHRSWLEASLEREDRILLVAEGHGSSFGAGPVGTVRWDREAPGEWEVSITVAPERRGQRMAGPLLYAGERYLAAGPGGDVTAYLAVVHTGNGPSRRLFASSGYLPDLPADDAGFMRLYKCALR